MASRNRLVAWIRSSLSEDLDLRDHRALKHYAKRYAEIPVSQQKLQLRLTTLQPPSPAACPGQTAPKRSDNCSCPPVSHILKCRQHILTTDADTASAAQSFATSRSLPPGSAGLPDIFVYSCKIRGRQAPGSLPHQAGPIQWARIQIWLNTSRIPCKFVSSGTRLGLTKPRIRDFALLQLPERGHRPS